MAKSFEERLEEAKTYVALASPFWATLLANLPISIGRVIGGFAATDGYNIILDPRSLSVYSSKTIAGIIMHEMMHVAYMHFFRGKNKIPLIWNIATDIVVNDQIIERYRYLKLPQEIVYNMDFAYMSAEEVYDRIVKQLYNDLGGKNGEEIDEKEAEEWLKKHFSEYFFNDKHGLPGEFGEQEEDENPEELEEKVREVIGEAYETYSNSRHRGTLPAGLVDFIEKLSGPKRDWKRILYQYLDRIFSKEDFSPLPPSRKYLPYDLYSPSLKSEEISGRIVIGVDTSGSMSSKEIGNALAEIDFVRFFVEEIFVLFHDVNVQEIVKPHNLKQFLGGKNIKIKGRGGTSHKPLFKYIEDHKLYPDLFIGFTDGYSVFPAKQPNYPVLWVLTKDHQKPPWGRIIATDLG